MSAELATVMLVRSTAIVIWLALQVLWRVGVDVAVSRITRSCAARVFDQGAIDTLVCVVGRASSAIELRILRKNASASPTIPIVACWVCFIPITCLDRQLWTCSAARVVHRIIVWERRWCERECATGSGRLFLGWISTNGQLSDHLIAGHLVNCVEITGARKNTAIDHEMCNRPNAFAVTCLTSFGIAEECNAAFRIAVNAAVYARSQPE
jgi:hypothetical protein